MLDTTVAASSVLALVTTTFPVSETPTVARSLAIETSLPSKERLGSIAATSDAVSAGSACSVVAAAVVAATGASCEGAPCESASPAPRPATSTAATQPAMTRLRLIDVVGSPLPLLGSILSYLRKVICPTIS